VTDNSLSKILFIRDWSFRL